jgi:MFS family permease
MSEYSMTRTHTPRTDWLRASLVSGFIATFALTLSIVVAYAIVQGLGDANGNTLQRWFAALSGNELTDRVDERFALGMILNLVVGLVWAAIYAGFFEPRLSGPGWRRGAIFAILPWLLSIVLFFAVVNIGVFGTGIDAGPLPVIGNGVLHLIYGVVLGSLYGLSREGNLIDQQANTNSEQIAALGMVLGTIAGGAGGWLVAPGLDNIASREACLFAGALAGGAIGFLIGSFLGLRVDADTA